MSPPSATVDLTGGRALLGEADTAIGAATAQALVDAGVRPVLLGADRDALRDVAARLQAPAWGVDPTDPAGLRAAATAAVDAIGPVDSVVTGPGRRLAGDLAGAEAAAIDGLVDMNLRYPLHLLAAVVPGLVAKGRGHVVLVGSSPGGLLGADTAEGSTVQAATMAGVTGLAAALRAELLGTGVKVSLVRAAEAAASRPRLLPFRSREPQPTTPLDVAAGVLEALHRGRAEVVVPAWLGFAPRLQALAPHGWAAVVSRLRRR